MHGRQLAGVVDAQDFFQPSTAFTLTRTRGGGTGRNGLERLGHGDILPQIGSGATRRFEAD
ncbi:hypothetical protein ABAC460_03515 [Asticcacaulis sp. AC460]|nr:hypothetical protein ABAC460_03515 [Asticcacaulis sp. AC460]